MPGHSVPLAGLGGFILIFGFLAFNGGSQVCYHHLMFSLFLLIYFFPLLISIIQASISQPGDGGIVALAIVNTILGASTGGLSVLMLIKVTPSGLLFSPLLPLSTPTPLPQFVWHHVDKSVDSGKWSFLMTLNGALCGMVSQGMQML